MNVLTVRVILTESAQIHLVHLHVPVKMDSVEMASSVEVLYVLYVR